MYVYTLTKGITMYKIKFFLKHYFLLTEITGDVLHMFRVTGSTYTHGDVSNINLEPEG